MMLITALVVSFCKDGGVSVNVNLWFLVVCVQCEVLCRFVVDGNVFLLMLLVVITTIDMFLLMLIVVIICTICTCILINACIKFTLR